MLIETIFYPVSALILQEQFSKAKKKKFRKLNFSGMMYYDPQIMKTQNPQKTSWS